MGYVILVIVAIIIFWGLNYLNKVEKSQHYRFKLMKEDAHLIPEHSQGPCNEVGHFWGEMRPLICMKCGKTPDDCIRGE